LSFESERSNPDPIFKNNQEISLPAIIRQGSEPGQLGFYLAGFIAAAFSGYLVIAFLLRFVQTHSFAVFAYYRFVLAGLVLLILIV